MRTVLIVLTQRPALLEIQFLVIVKIDGNHHFVFLFVFLVPGLIVFRSVSIRR